MIKTALHYILSFTVIFAALFAGNTIQTLLNVSIPGSVFGMLLLFILMAAGVIPVKVVQPGAHAFIRYMILLFVPVSVGLMNHFDTLINNALPILASAIGGTMIVLIGLSVFLDRFLKKGNK
ncbi:MULTISPECIES: CidA/LrgA family protein [Vibrio]|uniref:CidA/LrgA family protein n=1 Tax=Vibrio qingdaonensis TaxID=2829491 RepID=A0A9X3HUQ4_9VIBR|nr:CidA/LrgA family protein [Vibrio qingdaonensis]MCW8344481.1 CidA/LrgA family protein [Vibrio qingdaonensis]